MHPALIVVYALAVARLTRLAVADRITEAPRRRLSIRLWAPRISEEEAARRWPGILANRGLRPVQLMMAKDRLDDGAEPPLAVYLLTCPWCVSIYVAAVVAPLAYLWGSSSWLLVPALALAFSYITGWLAGKE